MHNTPELIDDLNIIKKYLEFIKRLPSIDLKLNTKLRQNETDHLVGKICEITLKFSGINHEYF